MTSVDDFDDLLPLPGLLLLLLPPLVPLLLPPPRPPPPPPPVVLVRHVYDVQNDFSCSFHHRIGITILRWYSHHLLIFILVPQSSRCRPQDF